LLTLQCALRSIPIETLIAVIAVMTIGYLWAILPDASFGSGELSDR